ncbi:hypothetical protein N657DRAFT_193688 [Parathielavia appendiculata]|uniref:Uncharacterized protein n=1 Tax=Parathielavia appendiculata TaxID=2587402 RepID=A0AAN6U6G1_9PEZI|nr:hypothetical protein N657DRAFT_193688 [Parathielavia appendiculata]
MKGASHSVLAKPNGAYRTGGGGQGAVGLLEQWSKRPSMSELQGELTDAVQKAGKRVSEGKTGENRGPKRQEGMGYRSPFRCGCGVVAEECRGACHECCVLFFFLSCLVFCSRSALWLSSCVPYLSPKYLKHLNSVSNSDPVSILHIRIRIMVLTTIQYLLLILCHTSFDVLLSRSWRYL